MTDVIDVKTYSDDASLNKAAPSIDSAELIKGEQAVTLDDNKIYILYFFNTFYRGADVCNEEFTKLSEKYGDKVTFIAISNDADKAKTEKYLAKEIVDENTKKPLRLAPKYIVFDDKKVIGKAYANVANLTVMSCPMGFIVANKQIKWRQQFLQTHTVDQSNFEKQLQHVLHSEELESNGPKPKVEVEEEEAEGLDGDISLF
uniref:Proline--tRNA ligase n=1 Tax=Lygus hesperus TaxID=30085 RepID=A0A0A9WZ10_LYGHE